MIINKEITEFIATKVLASSEVNDYCNNNFAKPLMLFIGVDNNNPPEVLDLPCLIVEPTVKTMGSKDSVYDYEIALHLGIKGNDKPLTSTNKVVYEGVYQIEELGNIIVNLINDEFSKSTNMDVYDATFYQDEINAFPTYSGVIVASMSVPNVIGSNKITFSC